MPDAGLTIVLLHGVVFLAAVLQSVTGIGFALIAGPVFLLVFDDSSAVQISIILNLVTALALMPFLYRYRSTIHLKQLLTGTALGLPVGIALHLWANLDLLKLGTGLMLVAIVVVMRRQPVEAAPRREGGGVAAGALSGLMAGFAAMPGPAASFYLNSRPELARDEMRATIFALFIASYTGALVFHGLSRGIASSTVLASLWLMPATVAGLVVGSIVEPHVNPASFKIIVLSTILLTGCVLVASAMT
jgi:uncharacterized membrane protein YfcA